MSILSLSSICKVIQVIKTKWGNNLYKLRLYQFLRVLIVIGAVIVICGLLKYTVLYLYPFILAILLSLCIHPFVSFFEGKLKFPRALATFVVITLLFLLINGALFLIVTELFQGTAYLADKVPAHFQAFVNMGEELLNSKILPLYHKVISFFHALDPSQQSAINENIKHFTNDIASTGTGLLRNILLKIPAILSLLPHSITVLTFIVLATFLITNDLPELKLTVKKIFPINARSSAKDIILHLKKAFFGFIKAQLMLIFITACIIFIGLTFLRADHVLTITLLASVVDLIPYIGTGLIFVPWIVYLFVTENYSMTIGLTILYMIIVISRQILEPKILSSNLGIKPLVALFGLFIGIQLWGLPGIIIAPILLVFLNALYQAGVMRKIGIFIKG